MRRTTILAAAATLVLALPAVGLGHPEGAPPPPCPLDPETGECLPPPVDTDGDGRTDGADNCPSVPNPGQEDNDQDGTGNVCDPTPDGDPPPPPPDEPPPPPPTAPPPELYAEDDLVRIESASLSPWEAYEVSGDPAILKSGATSCWSSTWERKRGVFMWAQRLYLTTTWCGNGAGTLTSRSSSVRANGGAACGVTHGPVQWKDSGGVGTSFVVIGTEASYVCGPVPQIGPLTVWLSMGIRYYGNGLDLIEWPKKPGGGGS